MIITKNINLEELEHALGKLFDQLGLEFDTLDFDDDCLTIYYSWQSGTADELDIDTNDLSADITCQALKRIILNKLENRMYYYDSKEEFKNSGLVETGAEDSVLALVDNEKQAKQVYSTITQIEDQNLPTKDEKDMLQLVNQEANNLTNDGYGFPGLTKNYAKCIFALSYYDEIHPALMHNLKDWLATPGHDWQKVDLLAVNFGYYLASKRAFSRVLLWETGQHDQALKLIKQDLNINFN